MKYLKHKEAEEVDVEEEEEVRGRKNKAQRRVIKRTLDCRRVSLLEDCLCLGLYKHVLCAAHNSKMCVYVCVCVRASQHPCGLIKMPQEAATAPAEEPVKPEMSLVAAAASRPRRTNAIEVCKN